MTDILKLARIELVVMVAFIFFKVIRPGILNNEPPAFVQVFLLSFPNFCEGIIGVITLTMVGLYFTRTKKINKVGLYIVAIVLATIFVITQEMKIHNLGGENVYDINDIYFSIAGLVLGFIIIMRMKPTIRAASNLG